MLAHLAAGSQVAKPVVLRTGRAGAVQEKDHARLVRQPHVQLARHVGEDHPELVGKLSREDILAMSEEVDD